MGALLIIFGFHGWKVECWLLGSVNGGDGGAVLGIVRDGRKRSERMIRNNSSIKQLQRKEEST
jgi:hypothetical protein